jgi:hypothetical protein
MTAVLKPLISVNFLDLIAFRLKKAGFIVRRYCMIGTFADYYDTIAVSLGGYNESTGS